MKGARKSSMSCAFNQDRFKVRRKFLRPSEDESANYIICIIGGACVTSRVVNELNACARLMEPWGVLLSPFIY